MQALVAAPTPVKVLTTLYINFEFTAQDTSAHSAPVTVLAAPKKDNLETLLHKRDDRRLVVAYRKYEKDRNEEKLLAVVKKVLIRKFEPTDGEWQSTDGLDEQDSVQEALMGLWESLTLRPLTTGADDFPRQVQQEVKNQRFTSDKRELRNKKRFVPITLTDEETGNSYDNPKLYSGQPVYENSIPWDTLDDSECMIVNAYLESTQEQVAEHFGVSTRTIGSRYAAIKEKIRNHEPTARRFKKG
jgi:hypothetical protein